MSDPLRPCVRSCVRAGTEDTPEELIEWPCVERPEPFAPSTLGDHTREEQDR